MSNEWKIAQGLKKKNENNRLNFEDAMVEKLNREQSLKDFKEDREWQENWGDFSISERTFDKSYEEVNVYEFQTFIQRCREKGLPLEGKKGDVAFTIISDNPLQVSFSVKDKDSNIVVNDNEVEYSQVEVRKEEWAVQYKHTMPTRVSRSVYVILGESQPEINEYYSLSPIRYEILAQDDYAKCENLSQKDQNDMLRKMATEKLVSKILSEHPEFSKGNDGEIYRLEVNPDEEIKPLRSKDGLGFYEHYDDSCYSKVDDKKDTYGEYIEEAQKIQEHCKYVYSLIVQAYKGLGEQVLTQVPEDEQKSKEIELADEIRSKQLKTKALEQEISSLEQKSKLPSK